MLLLVNENSPQSPIFDFGLFWPYLAKKRQKFTKNEENWQNSNRLMNFFENWFLDTSQQKKMLQKKLFFDSSLLWHFFGKKTAKIDQK